MTTNRRCVGMVMAMAVAGMAGMAWGLINPNFTPVHLVSQSGSIQVLAFRDKAVDGKITGTVVEVLKGDSDVKTVPFDLSFSPFEAKADAVEKMMANMKEHPIMFFVGDFEQEGGQGFDDGERKAFLHIGSTWVRFLESPDGGVWEMDDIDSPMHATWHGGPDMLLGCVRYVLASADPVVPVASGVNWNQNMKVGAVKGMVSEVLRVPGGPDGLPFLYVGASGGDRLYAWDKAKRAFVDHTEALKLEAKSLAAVWADLNADGKLDLLSWDGKGLVLHRRASDGSFVAAPVKTDKPLGVVCRGLAVVTGSVPGRPVVVFSRDSAPSLLEADEDGAMKVTALDPAKAVLADLGVPGACLVADFDTDSWPDVLQPFEKGSLFYKGTGPGTFAPAIPVALALHAEKARTALGDFTADGRFDVLVAIERFPEMWHNYDGLKFVQVYHETGEGSYIAKRGTVACAVGDINDDGRQDMLLIYGKGYETRPHIFFNRGFRSFGHAHSLDMLENGLIPESEAGQQAGLLGDLNGDGAQDMVVVLSDGSVWGFLREAFGGALSVQVALPSKGVVGPVRVTGHTEDRSMGAWNVTPSAEGFFAVIDPGPVTLRWRMPGGEERSKEIILDEGPVRFVLTP